MRDISFHKGCTTQGQQRIANHLPSIYFAQTSATRRLSITIHDSVEGYSLFAFRLLRILNRTVFRPSTRWRDYQIK